MKPAKLCVTVELFERFMNDVFGEFCWPLPLGTTVRVHKALEILRERERFIISKHYGFLPETQGYKLKEIAKLLSVSSTRIRQIRNNALTKLRWHRSRLILGQRVCHRREKLISERWNKMQHVKRESRKHFVPLFAWGVVKGSPNAFAGLTWDDITGCEAQAEMHKRKIARYRKLGGCQ